MLPSSLSPSQLAAYLTCERKWHYSYVEKLVPNGPVYMPFEKGSYIHQLLHYYYGLIKSGEYSVGEQALLEVISGRIQKDLQDIRDHDSDFDIVFIRDVLICVVNYIKNRSLQIDVGIKNLLVEHHIEYMYDDRLFHCFSDLIYIDKDKKHVIRDHKTGASNTFKLKNVYHNLQLRMNGMLWYLSTGNVADVEISYICSNPPKTDKAKTPQYDLIRVSHTKEFYENMWDIIVTYHERQKTGKTLHNLASCGSCAYSPICTRELRGVSTTLIKQAQYVSTSKGQDEIPKEDASGSNSNL